MAFLAFVLACGIESESQTSEPPDEPPEPTEQRMERKIEALTRAMDEVAHRRPVRHVSLPGDVAEDPDTGEWDTEPPQPPSTWGTAQAQ